MTRFENEAGEVYIG
jgi:hypothetical protein